MTYRQILVPDEKNHSIEMPEEFFGKKIEVIIKDIDDAVESSHPIPPPGKITSPDELLKEFGTAPDFPSIEEIRAKAWPSKW